MKSLFFLGLSLTLFIGSTSLNAQTECPNIEWMRFFNNDRRFVSVLSKINDDGSAIVYGSYGGSPSLGNYNLPLAAGGVRLNGFIAKVDSIGNPLWVKVAETIYNDQTKVYSLQTDASGNIYGTINFAGVIDLAGTTYTNNNSQQMNTLLVKLNQQGQVLWTKLYENCSFTLLHVDGQSQYYCVSTFKDTLSIDNQNYISNGGYDILIFKLNQQGHLLWAQQIGGIADETNNINWEGWAEFGSRADSQNNLYIAGRYESPAIMLGNTQLTNANSSEGKYFLAKMDSSGHYQWVKGLPENLWVSDLEIDNNHNVYLTGSVYDTVTIGNTAINVPPSTDLGYSFLIKYDPVADQFPMVRAFEGGTSVGSNLLYLPGKNEMIMLGAFKDTVNFITQNTSSTTADFFVLGIDLDATVEQPVPKWVIHSRNIQSVYSYRMIKDLNDNIYLSGVYFSDSVSFGQYNFPPISNVSNGFQAKLGNFLNREVAVNNGVLMAVQDSAIYQWLDCSNGMQPVAGATQQSFSPAQPGNYAVMVSNSLCSVVSDCINTTGISDLQQLQQINIYPNPVQETINLSHLPVGTQIVVFDVLGRNIYSGVAHQAKVQIGSQEWGPGVYVVALSLKGAKYYKKVVKE